MGAVDLGAHHQQGPDVAQVGVATGARGHLPQAGMKPKTTWSPGQAVDPGPTSSTTPAPSWPPTMGRGPNMSPVRRCSSLWHMPEAAMRTRTSPYLGGSSSISSTLQSLPVPTGSPLASSWLFPPWSGDLRRSGRGPCGGARSRAVRRPDVRPCSSLRCRHRLPPPVDRRSTGSPAPRRGHALPGRSAGGRVPEDRGALLPQGGHALTVVGPAIIGSSRASAARTDSATVWWKAS